MPLYHYQCPSCGREQEIRQGFDDPSPGCPDCGTLMRRRLFPAGVVFRGSGFYSTDYRGGRGGSGTSREKGDGPQKGGAAKEEAGSPTEAD